MENRYLEKDLHLHMDLAIEINITFSFKKKTINLSHKCLKNVTVLLLQNIKCLNSSFVLT